MKKVVMALLIISLLVPFVLFAEKKEAPMEEKPAPEAETMADKNAPDPWILDVRKGLDPYRGEIMFKGPQGQTPTWDTEVMLTVGEVEKLRAGNYKLGLARHGSQGEYTDALYGGAIDGCKHLGIKVVADTSAEFDDATLKSNIETIMATKPDAIIGFPQNRVTAAEIFKPVVQAGIPLVFISNQPEGFVHKRDFVGISTSMPYDQGKFMADAVAEGTKTKKVGIIFFDADFWITNFIDDVVRDTLATKYPDIEIVAENGYADVTTGVENAAAALIQQYPEVDTLYVSFNALYAAAACEAAGRKDIKIVSQGLDKPYMVNMLSGGNIYAIINDSTYSIGVNTALLAGYGILGKSAPEYTISPSAIVTKDNLKEMWNLAFRIVPFPKEIEDLMK
jgi:ribose transport system substrate-binding protein